MEFTITFIILAVTIFLFISNRIRADLVSIFAMLALILTGVLEPQEGLAGFSSSVVIMFAGLFVVGAGLYRTGLAQKAGNLLLRLSGNSEKRLFVLLILIVAFVGAFMSNTGTVAIMLPVVTSIALSIKTDASKYLIPLSFAANLSGILTLIASPPNLIVSQTLVDHGFKQLGFFEITPIGIVCVIVGVIYMYSVRNVLLPKRGQKRLPKNDKKSPNELLEIHLSKDKLHCVQVPEGSAMVGKKLSDLKLPAKYQLFVLKIDRKAGEKRLLLPMTYHEMAGPDSEIHENDVLYIQGSRQNMERFADDFQLQYNPDKAEPDLLVTKEMGVAEALLTPSSGLIGKTLFDIRFREKYNLNIIGINRKGKYILKEMASLSLNFGDALLVQGRWKDIELLSKDTADVVLIGQPKEMASMASASGKAPIAGAIMLFMVLMLIFEVFAPVVSVLISAVLMILTGCLRNMDDAYAQINWQSIILMACMIPVATALEKTGGVAVVTEGIIQIFGQFGPSGVLAGIMLATMLFGQFISNTATTVLFAPIAMSAALTLGVNPYTFLIGVASAAAMSFTTPVASPTNVLVMTAGGYKFTDFVKIGVPFQIIMFVVLMVIVPLFFPF